jgi:hypothetical protein
MMRGPIVRPVKNGPGIQVRFMNVSYLLFCHVNWRYNISLRASSVHCEQGGCFPVRVVVRTGIATDDSIQRCMHFSSNKKYQDVQGGNDESCMALPKLEELVSKRDFIGAITLLQVPQGKDTGTLNNEWFAYCYFHSGQYSRALQVYETLLATPEADPMSQIYAASCEFYLGNYKDAVTLVETGPPCALATRILLHCAHAVGDEEKLVEYHGQVSKTLLEDQLSLAAIHFRRSHFQVHLESTAPVPSNSVVSLAYLFG